MSIIPLSRRINKSDGSFGGVVILGLQTEYFLEFYQKIDLGQNSLISLIGMDGFTRARQTNSESESSQDIRESNLWKNIQARPNGTVIANNYQDKDGLITSYRVMPDYPLVVAVGESIQVALADYEERKRLYIFGATLINLFILALCVLLVNRAKEQQAHKTQLERTLLELQKSNIKLVEQAQLLDLAHDYIMVSDLDNKIIYWNRGAESGYHLPVNEAIGQLKHSLLKTQFPISEEYIMDKLLTEGYWEGELNHTRKDGKQIVVCSYQTLNRDAAGNSVSILEINHDITEQKQLEADLARLDRLNLIGEMAAAIGHEIRNPLTAVRGYLQFFQGKKENAKYRTQYQMMVDELDRANGIISEFLSLAKNKAIELKSYNLNDIISALLPLLQAEAFRTGHEIQVDMGDAPNINLDEKEIRQLLLNLSRNGFEAMETGGRLTIETYTENDKVVLAVRDNGTGIPQGVLDKLGTPFLTTKDTGTGLGLPVCYRIAEHHNAKIVVAIGLEGTTFTVEFNHPA